MPPRPFPFSFRVGTDICSVKKLNAIVTRHNEENPLIPLNRFMKRVFTEPERQYFWDRFAHSIPMDEVLNHANAISTFLAGRFAAKEACRKACDCLDPDSRGYQSIMILPVIASTHDKHQSSRPQGLILDKAYKIALRPDPTNTGLVRKTNVRTQVDVNELDGQLCEVSISHDGDYATAVAIVPSMITGADKIREIRSKQETARVRKIEFYGKERHVKVTGQESSDPESDEGEAYW